MCGNILDMNWGTGPECERNKKESRRPGRLKTDTDDQGGETWILGGSW